MGWPSLPRGSLLPRRGQVGATEEELVAEASPAEEERPCRQEAKAHAPRRKSTDPHLGTRGPAAAWGRGCPGGMQEPVRPGAASRHHRKGPTSSVCRGRTVTTSTLASAEG